MFKRKGAAQPQGGLPDSTSGSPREEQAGVQGSLLMISLCLSDTSCSLASNSHGEKRFQPMRNGSDPALKGADLSGHLVRYLKRLFRVPWAARILKPSAEGASHLTHGARSLKLWERSTRVANFNV